MVRRVLLLPALLVVLSGVVVGCDSEVSHDSSEVRVVASTALIAEFASVVAGDDVMVIRLIPPGVDLHSFEPAPAIAAAIAQADLILVNGHDLEESLLKVIEQNVSDGVGVVAVSDGIEVLLATGKHAGDDGEAHAGVDPHLWLDALNAVWYVKVIRDALIEVSPEHVVGYRERAAGYIAELQSLHDELVAELEAIPVEERRLVVFHDAYRYFAAAYGLELLAVVLPAGAQQDPSAGTVASLIELVETSGVRVVFAEPQFNSTVLDQIASEAGVGVRPLYSTFTGEVDNYIELMRANAGSLSATQR